ncbi:hypothetical protein [Microvirga massiliensis]|uniref:hypothetical protein n=1 Tax=Microvirga massiliensis TaxID=1033741 RepID=UPI00062B51FE|nr:hypothetical protein [Microvirga massiliensis]
MTKGNFVYIGEAARKLRAELAREGRLYVVEENPSDLPAMQKHAPWTTRCTGPHNLGHGGVDYYRSREEAEWSADYNNRAEVLRYFDQLESEEIAERLRRTMPPEPGKVAKSGPYGVVFDRRRHWYVVDGAGSRVSGDMRWGAAKALADTYNRRPHGHGAGTGIWIAVVLLVLLTVILAASH